MKSTTILRRSKYTALAPSGCRLSRSKHLKCLGTPHKRTVFQELVALGDAQNVGTRAGTLKPTISFRTCKRAENFVRDDGLGPGYYSPKYSAVSKNVQSPCLNSPKQSSVGRTLDCPTRHRFRSSGLSLRNIGLKQHFLRATFEFSADHVSMPGPLRSTYSCAK